MLIKKILDNISKTYQRNNFGTMRTWSSPKKLEDYNNEAYIYNYLTLVNCILLITYLNIFLFVNDCSVLLLYCVLTILEVYLMIIN